MTTSFKEVLFLEDEPEINSIGVHQLRQLGYTVWPALTVAEALDLFEEHKDRIGIFLTDNRLPDGLGMRVAKELLTVKPELVVAVISGFFIPEEVEELRKAGIPHFAKPILYSQVIRELHLPTLQTPSRNLPVATPPVEHKEAPTPPPLPPKPTDEKHGISKLFGSMLGHKKDKDQNLGHGDKGPAI